MFQQKTVLRNYITSTKFRPAKPFKQKSLDIQCQSTKHNAKLQNIHVALCYDNSYGKVTQLHCESSNYLKLQHYSPFHAHTQ